MQLIKKEKTKQNKGKQVTLPRHTSLMFQSLLARETDYIEHLRNKTSAAIRILRRVIQCSCGRHFLSLPLFTHPIRGGWINTLHVALLHFNKLKQAKKHIKSFFLK